MTGSFIPNFDCSYKGIRTAPRHKPLAVQQHGAQQQVSKAGLIMRGIILSCRAGVKFVSYGPVTHFTEERALSVPKNMGRRGRLLFGRAAFDLR